MQKMAPAPRSSSADRVSFPPESVRVNPSAATPPPPETTPAHRACETPAGPPFRTAFRWSTPAGRTAYLPAATPAKGPAPLHQSGPRPAQNAAQSYTPPRRRMRRETASPQSLPSGSWSWANPARVSPPVLECPLPHRRSHQPRRLHLSFPQQVDNIPVPIRNPRPVPAYLAQYFRAESDRTRKYRYARTAPELSLAHLIRLPVSPSRRHPSPCPSLSSFPSPAAAQAP